MNGLLEYIWQISEGNTVLRRVVDDYYVTGLGAALVYVDPMMDMGKGEVCIHDVDPLDIYIDPNSRHPLLMMLRILLYLGYIQKTKQHHCILCMKKQL